MSRGCVDCGMRRVTPHEGADAGRDRNHLSRLNQRHRVAHAASLSASTVEHSPASSTRIMAQRGPLGNPGLEWLWAAALPQLPESPSSKTVSLGPPGRTPPSTTLCRERESQRVWASGGPDPRLPHDHRRDLRVDQRERIERPPPQNLAPVRDIERPRPISQPGPPSTTGAA